jgi:hypothetical protein
MKTVWTVLGGIGLVLVILFSGAIGKLVGKGAVDSYYSGKKEGFIDEALLKTASEINSKLPMMVDSETRLDSTVGLNKSFRYNYTLINYASSSVSASELNSALGQKLINNVCTSKEMQVFVKNGVTVSYAYFGNDGNQVTIISVAPSQCGGT